jgi:DNA-binding response OmpR family regulator
MTMQDNQDLGNCEDQHTPSLGTVLLVEDNLRVSDELSLVLTTAGYTTRCAYDGEHMRALLAMMTPDLVMLDLNLPSEDGISLCKWLRDIHPFMGIVMLTARVMGSERTEGYQAGADVYLTKPTRPEEILAVIRNLMRRHDRHASTTLSAANVWTLHQKSMSLSAPDSDVLSLTPKEAIVLLNLAQTSAHCTYDYLIDKLIGESPRTTFDKVRLEVVISRLRSKLFKFKAQSFEIKTIHGTGYRLSKPLKLRPN